MDKLKYIASRLGLFVVFKKIFGPVLRRRKLKAFRLGKNDILKDLKSVYQSGGRFFLVFGTFLGARRNGSIIPGDDDFDLGVFLDDFPVLDKLLKDCNFKLKLMIKTEEENPVLAKYIKKGVIVDVFIHYKTGNKTVCFDHVDINRTVSLNREVEQNGYMVLFENRFSAFKLENCSLESVSFLCPEEKPYLQEAYGQNYLIPDASLDLYGQVDTKEVGFKRDFG